MGVTAALALGIFMAPVQAKTYDWPLPTTGSVTIDIPRGSLTVLTRDDDKSRISLDLESVDVARESTRVTRKVTGDLPDETPQWFLTAQGATLKLPEPAAIDFLKVGGVTATLTLPASGKYVINGRLVDIEMKGAKSDISVNVVDGNVMAQQALGGNLSISVMHGGITTRSMKSNLALKVSSGNITDQDSEGDIAVDLVSGALTLDSQAKAITIRQITGEQHLNLPASVTFVNDLQTGTSILRLGSALKRGEIETAQGDITVIVTEAWQGSIVADSINAHHLINQLSSDKPQPSRPPLSDERLEITRGKADAGQLKLSTLAGKITLQRPVKAGE
ncbi:hypothetical protein CIG19_04085 [Enterobacterales bacterium CwR94]|nr:hypothetical protein CIG19_04085 [Enterobacterales bacterium CwR94]